MKPNLFISDGTPDMTDGEHLKSIYFLNSLFPNLHV